MTSTRKLVAGLTLGLVVLAGCNDSGVAVSREDADFDWPFSVGEGTVECRHGGEVVFVSNGVTYSINGTADAFAQQRGYRDVRPIWLDNAAIPGTKISIAPIIRIGLEIC